MSKEKKITYCLNCHYQDNFGLNASIQCPNCGSEEYYKATYLKSEFGVCIKTDRKMQNEKKCWCNKQIIWFFDEPTIIACENCEITLHYDQKKCPVCGEEPSYFVREDNILDDSNLIDSYTYWNEYD